jgi:hypothetical protein
MEQKEAKAVVTRAFRKAGESEKEQPPKEETLAVRCFVTEPAKVSFEYGVTMNLGNYESARVTVQLSVPCYREEIEEAAEFAKSWVEKRIQSEVAEVRGGGKGDGSLGF